MDILKQLLTISRHVPKEGLKVTVTVNAFIISYKCGCRLEDYSTHDHDPLTKSNLPRINGNRFVIKLCDAHNIEKAKA